jgi:DNA-binding transcriptional regulator YiaG
MPREDIERNAREDADNPPLTEAELARLGAARAVLATRVATGLSQGKFARAYRINPARLRHWEQGAQGRIPWRSPICRSSANSRPPSERLSASM